MACSMFHKHFDPTILNSAFKLISDEYGVKRGICQYAIHYHTYKDLVEYPLITTMEMRYNDTLLYAKQT